MEKAATKAKSTGSGAFAALVKDCGDANPFSKFLGPTDGLPGVSPGGGGSGSGSGGGSGSSVGRPAGANSGSGGGGGRGGSNPPSSTLMPGSHIGSHMHVGPGNSNNSNSGSGNPFGGNFGDYGGGDGLTPGYHDDGIGDTSYHSARASQAASRAAYEMDLRIQRI